ncbi:hypothetical protein HD553DRAFT_303871 [Filobasidium floriforme]|uniref:uncharacterized protein n=1 Tax=Filobasidium floriforme TaxID=5210 RepID=UPI001E8CAB6C|nr:uncharacterized protein HD553DRAFT_303871 [Filobasidium floriforme]KAH8089383.1 hypothetical protein HD553DRAFT_303871 [Filobasidium floriforme]
MDDLSTNQDLALRTRPWLAKTVGNQLYMLKYIYFESNAIFLATTLDKVYLEVLSPSRLLSRASASAKLTQDAESFSYKRASYSQNTNADSQNLDVAVQKCVAGLDALFSPGEAWDDVDIELGESDTFYDLMLDISSDDFDWNIKFSKVDDSSALNMIRDHILYPLVALSGCLMDRLGESSSGVAELQTAIDTSATTAVRRLTPLLKNTLNRPLLQTSMSRWTQVRQGTVTREPILEEYPTEAFSPVLRPAFGEAAMRESETPPPNSPDYRNLAPNFGNQADLPTLDLSPAQAQMSAELEMKSFSPSPLPQAVSNGDNREDANEATGSSDMEWNSDMTEPESDDEEATRKFEMARDRTLARRARTGLRTQGPPQDEIPDTPDQVEDSQVRLESTDVQTIPSPTPDSPPRSFEVRPTGRQKRKSTGSPGPMKRPRSTSPIRVEDTRTVLDQTESQKHEAALAMRNALHTGAGAGTMGTASNNANSGTTASRARATGAAGGRGRGRGRGKSVW